MLACFFQVFWGCLIPEARIAVLNLGAGHTQSWCGAPNSFKLVSAPCTQGAPVLWVRSWRRTAGISWLLWLLGAILWGRPYTLLVLAMCGPVCWLTHCGVRAVAH